MSQMGSPLCMCVPEVVTGGLNVVTDGTKVVTNEGKVATNEAKMVTNGPEVTTGSLFLPPNEAILLRNERNGQTYRLFP
jgi:hypothetical protein